MVSRNAGIGSFRRNTSPRLPARGRAVLDFLAAETGEQASVIGQLMASEGISEVRIR